MSAGQPFTPNPTGETAGTSRAMRQRALGAIIGSAVGDALGAPFEFGPAGAYSTRFPSPVIGGAGEMTGGGTFGWKPGEFTDDTQMAVIQAESLLDHGGLDEADLFGRFRIWSADAADVGNQTRAVLASPLVGSEAAEAHFRRSPRAAAGNGSVMRSAPTAVLCSTGTEDETIAMARATSAVTHGDPAAGWGTAIQHAMVRAAVRGEEPFAALDRVLATLPVGQARYREMLAPTWTPSDSRLANGSVWGCLAQAVWAVRSTDSFSGALVAAIDLGGDTDTVAAVTGALAGAIHGIASIPSRWTTYLNGSVTTLSGRRRYRLADLTELTNRLLGATVAPEHRPDPAVGPTEIAAGIYAANLTGAEATPNDWAVVSLCRVGERFADHGVRRELYLIDQIGDHNADLGSVVDDAIASIDAFRAEGRNVVVHCFGGASRTGLVLRAWLMATNGWTDAAAISHIENRWPHLDLWNLSFTEHLAGR